jgi:Fe-S-cluster containining protein
MPIERLWGRIPDGQCTGACWECCGPVPFLPVERAKVQAAADLLGVRWTAAPDQVSFPVVGADGICPFLTADHRCGIYENRPTVCRMFGVVPGLPCENGCTPALSAREETIIMTAYLTLAERAERRALTRRIT